MFETKYVGGSIVECKNAEDKRNGEDVGIVKGYIATWDADQGGRFGVPDIFHKGAFLESIEEHKKRNDRPVRLKDNHGRTIGGFPIDTVHEDAIGLFGVGEINLVSRQGKEAFSLARQGVLTDFSIGFTALDDTLGPNKRDIFKARIWEGSITDEPINQSANITEVKVAVPFQDLPLAERMATWNPNAAKSRVKDFLESKTAPGPEFKTAFAWMDLERAERFDGYKLQLADVQEGTLIAIPRAIFKAANDVKSKAAGLPEEDRAGVIQHLERYYAKMGLVSPFTDDDKHFFGIEEVKMFTRRELERSLIDSGAYSRSAAVDIASRMSGLKLPPKSILDALKGIKI